MLEAVPDQGIDLPMSMACSQDGEEYGVLCEQHQRTRLGRLETSLRELAEHQLEVP